MGNARYLADALEQALGGALPVGVRTWDGGCAGPDTAGFEIRDVVAMREHYVRTIDAWAATLEDRWDEVVARVGVGWARVWRLYLAGAALSFEENRMGVDQIVAVA